MLFGSFLFCFFFELDLEGAATVQGNRTEQANMHGFELQQNLAGRDLIYEFIASGSYRGYRASTMYSIDNLIFILVLNVKS